MALPQRCPPTPAPSSPAAARVRVLIADDCDGTREVVAQMLGDGFETVVFDNGACAWERIQSDASIAALITDIEMPGLSGFELIDRIRKCADARVRALPVIAITGAVDSETRRRAFVSGATGMVTKPIDRAQLLALVQVYFRPQPAMTAAPAPIAASEQAPAQVADDQALQPKVESIEFPAVAKLEHRVQEESAATPASLAIPAELISIDAALQAIHAGRSDLLLPYLGVLEQRLQPLLACHPAKR